MPPLELSPDPANLSADELRRVAFIVGRGAVAFDYEDPHAGKSFLEADAATQLAAEEAAAQRPAGVGDGCGGSGNGCGGAA